MAVARKLGAVLEQTGARLVRQVQTPVGITAHLDQVHGAQALSVVLEAAVGARQIVQHALAGVTERRVTQVVREHDGLGEILVEAERARHRARDLRDLERVRQAIAVVVALGQREDLRLVL